MKTGCWMVLGLAVALWARLPAAEDYVWWEGEAALQHNFSNKDFRPAGYGEKRNGLSGGDWLNNGGKRKGPEIFAKYQIEAPASGEYQFWTRKFWKHGPFRWRFDQQAWRTCGRDIALADTYRLAKFICANWVYLGKVKLDKGKHGFELRLLAKEGAGSAACFDCFVLTRGVFTPRGKRKPGEKSGKAAPGFFAFEPPNDHFGADALLDLRSLNEKEAGEHGFVRRDGLNFVRGDGKPLKFWSVQIGVDMDNAALDYLARRLAKNGVNLARIHTQVADWKHGAAPTAINKKHLDRIHYAVAAMKRAGIYVYLGHVYWANWRPPARWGLPGYNGKKAAHGLVMFNKEWEAAYRAWAKALLTAKNPYTGIPLKDEPALAVYEIQNEDSLLFWTFNLGRLPASLRTLVEKQYAAFLVKKHGSLEKALQAWGGAKRKNDAPGAGRLALLEPWFLASGGLKKQPRWKKRASDQLQFLVETQRAFYERTVKYVKADLGAKCLVACSNWKTADARLLDALERYTYLAGDVVCRNNYFGPRWLSKRKRFYAVDTGEVYADRSGLFEPQNLPIQLNQIDQRPHMVTEIMWERPNRFRAEFPFLAAAYGSLQGMDGWNFFALGNAQWESAPGVWSVMCPSIFGMFPACALLYRRGDVREAKTVVHQSLSLKEQYRFKGSAVKEVQGFDELRKKDIPAGGLLKGKDFGVMDPLAFYVGRAVYDCLGDPSKNKLLDFSKYVDHAKKTIQSITGELRWDYGRGVVTVDTPRAQGACGFLSKAGKIALGSLAIESGNEYAAILAVSLDAQPLAASKKILLQAVTDDQLYGWKTQPRGKGKKILALGGYPLNVRKIEATVTLKGAAPVKATLLDGNGYAKGKAGVNGKTLTLPPDALYVIVER